MAAVNDCFSIGSVVMCTTCFGDQVQGEVLAFEQNFLILKCQSKTSESLNDIHIVNVSLCKNVQVLKEYNGHFVEDPQKLNVEQLKMRYRKTVQNRQTYLKSKNANVSSEAQELYRVIAKQFKYNEVSWHGLNIQILNEVTISPPYKSENVISTCNKSTLCKYIKKMIDQFYNTRVAPESNSNTGTASNTSSTSSSISSSTPLASVGTSNAASSSPVPAN